MNIFKTLKFLYKSKDEHFLYVSSQLWKKWGWIIRLSIILNPNYKSCKIYRKKWKFLTNIVVVGLKWNGRNVKRRTSGFAKEFLQSNRNAKCIYCGIKLTEDNSTTDHIIPISSGGNNCQVNLIVCCFDCNNERGNLHFNEYLKIKNPKFKGLKRIYI